MTVVASRRAVDVPIHLGMLHARLMRGPRMAINTRKLRVVRRDQVAVRTDRAIVRNAEPGVLSCCKCRPQPARGDPRGVTGHASGRELRGDMIWHLAAKSLRAQPSRLMASVAIGVRRRQRVVAVDMA